MPIFDPESISNPTLAVMEEFNITDPQVRGLVWNISGSMADELWGRYRSTPRTHGDLYDDLVELAGTLPAYLIVGRLANNLNRAIAWCKANA